MRLYDQQQQLNGRVTVVEYFVLTAFAVLVFGFWHHQVIREGYFAELADRNRFREIKLLAPRGRIYDREGRLLVDNRPSYNIVLIRENSPRTSEETASRLAVGIALPEKEILDRINRHRKEPRYQPIVVKEDVSLADIAFVKSHRYELSEISVEFQPRRRYLGSGTAAHLLGYIGEVTEPQLTTPEFLESKVGDIVGQFGLERQYNSILRGKDGFKRVVVNNYGREVDRLYEAPPLAGNDLFLTIDTDLQKAAEETLGDRAGAVVALDPQTGEILAMVSRPTFDPNLFATRISTAQWSDLINDPKKPLQNRVIQSRYSPGSVFKVVMAAAALESDVVNPLHTLFCNGGAVFYGRTFACWKKGGHGAVGIHDALVDSCNVFFYTVGRDLGIDRIAHWATSIGLGRKTGVDLPNEDPGLIPSPEWKQRVFKTNWYAGETISVSIGQGAVSTTPLQLTWAVGGIASGGRLRTPHLVKPETIQRMGLKPPEIQEEQYPIHQSTVDIIARALWGVVNESGTGTRARVPGFDVAGKTGTAQVVGKQTIAVGEQFQDHAWFIGFAPYRTPQIAVGAFVENGGHGGGTSAPVAKAILEMYYFKKTGRFHPPETIGISRMN